MESNSRKMDFVIGFVTTLTKVGIMYVMSDQLFASVQTGN
jgi:hypothetical protein